MATLTVWKFDDEDGAARAADVLSNLVEQHLITVEDAAIVSWPVGKKKPRTSQLDTGNAALGGAFWGFLFGLLFFIPLVGMAIGAVAGGLSSALTEVGIDDGFVASVRSKLTPGTSALFLMSSGAVLDKVHEAFSGTHAELIQTNMDTEQEERLRAAFADD